MAVFAPEPFGEPVVTPDTQTLFRRTPYISPQEYEQAPTAVGVNTLVPGGTAEEQLAAMTAVISRASDWLDTICFHKADGTLAASPSTESGWITSKRGGELAVICNYKPILEVDAFAIGVNPNQMQNIGNEAAKSMTISGNIIRLPTGWGSLGPVPFFSNVPTTNGKVWAVWTYVNGFPHSYLTKEAKVKATEIEVGPSVPGGTVVYGVYPGTQLTIHDGANTEVILVKEVVGLKLKLQSELLYTHKPPTAPNTIRVSAVPWIVEQACISLCSALIKKRGSRAMVLPQSPESSQPGKQVSIQAGGQSDFESAYEMLLPFISTYVRST